MNYFKKLIAATAFSLLVLTLPTIAAAQWGNNNQKDDDYYGNRSSVELSYSVKNLRNSSKRFADQLDRELDRSRLDGTDREDFLNNLAKRFKDAAKDLDDEYDGRRNQRNSTNEARRVLETGSRLDQAMARSRIGRNAVLSNSWSAIERDLANIARGYNIRYNGTYANNGRNGRYDPRDDNRGNDRGNNRNLRATVVNLRNNARKFEKRVDREYDTPRNKRGIRGGDLQNLASRFKDATDHLADQYDGRRDYNQSVDEIERVLNLGQQVERAMARSRVSGSLQSDWNRVAHDLRELDNAYNLAYNTNNRRGRFPF